MLSASAELTIPPECDFLWRSAARFGRAADMRGREREFVECVAALSSFEGLEVQPDDILRRLQGRSPLPLSECIGAVYAVYADKRGRARWGDKNPFYVLHLDLVEALFPEAHVIHMVRDARDVVASYQKTKMRPHHLLITAKRWQRCVRAGRRWGAERPDRYLEIRYEELVATPEREMRRTCAFAHMAYSDRMLEFHAANRDLHEIPPGERQHHQNLARPIMRSNSEKWRSELSPHEIRLVEHVTAPLLEAAGYRREAGRLAASERMEAAVLTARYRLGRAGLVDRMLPRLPWRARAALRRALLVDNEHYR
jgi:hypothetical protein